MVSGWAKVTLASLLLVSILLSSGATFVSAQDGIQFNLSNATYGLNGDYPGITVSVTNVWPQTLSVVVYATFRSGTSIYIAESTATVAPNATLTIFCIDVIPIPAGLYAVTFVAITLTNLPISSVTPPVSTVVT